MSCWGGRWGNRWGGAWGSIEAAASTPTQVYSGGYLSHVRDRKKRYREEILERLRGEPVEVAQVIAQVAVDAVDERQEVLAEALTQALEREALEYRARYVELLQEIRIEHERQEEEEIALLLLMH